MHYNKGTAKDKESQSQKDRLSFGKEGGMVLSDHIAAMIEKMLEEGGGHAEVRRNDLAQKLGETE